MDATNPFVYGEIVTEPAGMWARLHEGRVELGDARPGLRLELILPASAETCTLEAPTSRATSATTRGSTPALAHSASRFA